MVMEAGTTYYLFAGYFDNIDEHKEYEASLTENDITYVYPKINGSDRNHLTLAKGRSYVLEADAVCRSGISATYEWYTLDESDSKTALPEMGSKITYTESGAFQGWQTIRCTVSSPKETETISFYLEYHPLRAMDTFVDGKEADFCNYQMNRGYMLRQEAGSDAQGALTYTWRMGDTVLQNGTDDTYTFTPTKESLGGTYQSFVISCDVSDREGNKVTSDIYFYYRFVTDLKAEINGQQIPLKKIYNVIKEIPYELKVSASAEPGKTLTYQWQDTDGNVLGAGQTYQYTVTGKKNSERIICVISDGADSYKHYFRFKHKPLNARLTVNGSSASGNAIPVQTGKSYQFDLSVQAKPDASLTYQWGILDNKNFVAIPGQTGSSYICKINKAEDAPITTKAATAQADGIVTNTCQKCGHTQTAAIAKISDIRLSNTSLDYNGKNQDIALTVRGRTGRQLRAGTDYDYTFGGKKNAGISAKNVGQYTVNLVFKGSYSGNSNVTFTVIPKKMSLSKALSAKKGFKAVWKKQDAQADGYELSYSTKKSFAKKATKTVRVKGFRTTSRTVKKLKAKTKYYVRIRAYKNIKVGNKTVKLCGKWSAQKTVKTK